MLRKKFTDFAIEITYRCNLKCTYCCVPSEEVGEVLSENRLLEITQEGFGLVKRGMAVSGGEPLLRPELLKKILKIADAYKLVRCVLSNGMLIEDNLDIFENVEELRISLDDINDPVRYRLNSNVGEIIRNIRKAREKYPDSLAITITTLLNGENIYELEQMYNLLKELDVDRWLIGLASRRGRMICSPNRFFPPGFEESVKQITHLLEIYLKETQKPFPLSIPHLFDTEDLNDININKFNLDEHPCSYRFEVLWLTGKGEMRFCPDLDTALIKDIFLYPSIKEAVEVGLRHPFLHLKIKDIEKCVSCRYLYLCGTGCRANAFHWTGSLFLPDPISCTLRTLWERHILPILPKSLQEKYQLLINKNGRQPQIFNDAQEIIEFFQPKETSLEKDFSLISKEAN